MPGAVTAPGDSGWDAARAAWDLSVNQDPADVICPADASGVIMAVDAARAAGLRIAVQSTGHAAGPLGSLDDTVLLKTSRLALAALATTTLALSACAPADEADDSTDAATESGSGDTPAADECTPDSLDTLTPGTLTIATDSPVRSASSTASRRLTW